MTKYISILSLIVFFFLINNPLFAQHKIDWNKDNLLTWNDFQGPAPGFSQKVAATNYEIGYEYTMIDNEFFFKVSCQFVKPLSWVHPKGKTEYILLHEQKHFDLAEVYARKLRLELSEANITLRNYKKVIDEVYNKVWLECQIAQEEYDHQTDHSINEAAQEKWNKKIQQMLDKTKNFAAESPNN